MVSRTHMKLLTRYFRANKAVIVVQNKMGVFGIFSRRKVFPWVPKGWLLAAGASLTAFGAGLYLRTSARSIGMVTVGAGVCLLGSAALRRHHPQKVKVGVVTEVVIHPIKSCRGVSVNEAECTEVGLQVGDLKDRHWIVTQENGQKVTARQEPRLVLISVSCENGHLILNAPDMEELRVPVKLPESNLVKTIRVWGSDIPGRDCGDEASHWITTFLKSSQPYRLAQFEPNMKYRNAKEKNPYFRPSDKIVYPDASPILLITEASLEDLNTRLEKKVQMRNFRPVIVVSGCSAFEEDSWDHIQIGSVILVRVMACPRCILTTVNPDTGVIDRIEPLETLKSYRMSDPSEKHIYKSAPLFGQFYAVDMTGHIKVGDAVYRLL